MEGSNLIIQNIYKNETILHKNYNLLDSKKIKIIIKEKLKK